MSTTDYVPGSYRKGFIGEVKCFAGITAPNNWAFCDGSVFQVGQQQALFDIIGNAFGGDPTATPPTFALPDLRGRTVIGAGQGPGLSNRVFGTAYGSEEETLTENQMPAHKHDFSFGNAFNKNANGSSPSYFGIFDGTTLTYSDKPATGKTAGQGLEPKGGGQAHNNMPPFTVVNWMICLSGDVPSATTAFHSDQQPLLGEMVCFAGTFAPKGWQFCHGQVLNKDTSNTELSSLLENIYGGDLTATTPTFALPDMRGRRAIGINLKRYAKIKYRLGITGGFEEANLDVYSMPKHNHWRSKSANNAYPNQSSPFGNSLGKLTGDPNAYYDTTASSSTSLIGHEVLTAGGDQPHNNVSPCMALHWIICIEGEMPRRPKKGRKKSFQTPAQLPDYAQIGCGIIGEIKAFAGKILPGNYEKCDGSMRKESNDAVLAKHYFWGIVGRRFNPVTSDPRKFSNKASFPDLGGRSPLGAGSGPGLSARSLGTMGGSEKVTLSQLQLPAHGHEMADNANEEVPNQTNPIGNCLCKEASSTNVYNDQPPTDDPHGAASEVVPTGGGGAHENRDPFLTVMWTIFTGKDWVIGRAPEWFIGGKKIVCGIKPNGEIP